MSIGEGTAVEQLGALKELAKERQPTKLPSPLPTKRIEVCAAVFQPRRGTTEHHVQSLLKAMERVGDLDPVLVIQLGRRTFVVDGHHRLEAYKAAKRSAVPVVYFKGTVDEAVRASGDHNTRAKLPMRGAERHDFAWRLVTFGSSHSKREIMLAAGVSDGQVANMRRAAEKLGPEAKSYTSWFLAREAAHGRKAGEWPEVVREQWEEEQAELLAERLAKAWGSRGIQHPRVAARALLKYYGREIGALGEQLAEHMPTPEQLRDDHYGSTDF